MKTTNKIILFLSLGIILAAGLYAVIYAKTKLPPTFDGSQINVEELYADQSKENLKYVDGAASVIVQKNLAEAQAANDVASVVFDFRGYDTLGESFILLTAIAGSFVILARSHAKSKEKDEGKEERP